MPLSDDYVKTLRGLRVVDAETYLLAGLALKQREIVLAGKDGLTVNLLDDAARLDIRRHQCQRASLDDLLNPQAVTGIGIIIEHSKIGCRIGRSAAVVSGTGMGGIKLWEALSSPSISPSTSAKSKLLVT